MAWYGGRYGGRGNRWMYRLTGLPGWIRFGFSPGWVGVTPTGLPPTAQWIISSGLLPQFLSYIRTVSPAATTYPTFTPQVQPILPSTTGLSKEQEKAMLEQQVNYLKSQLEAINKRLKELEGKG